MEAGIQVSHDALVPSERVTEDESLRQHVLHVPLCVRLRTSDLGPGDGDVAKDEGPGDVLVDPLLRGDHMSDVVPQLPLLCRTEPGLTILRSSVNKDDIRTTKKLYQNIGFSMI